MFLYSNYCRNDFIIYYNMHKSTFILFIILSIIISSCYSTKTNWKKINTPFENCNSNNKYFKGFSTNSKKDKYYKEKALINSLDDIANTYSVEVMQKNNTINMKSDLTLGKGINYNNIVEIKNNQYKKEYYSKQTITYKMEKVVLTYSKVHENKDISVTEDDFEKSKNKDWYNDIITNLELNGWTFSFEDLKNTYSICASIKKEILIKNNPNQVDDNIITK
mgnify:CR=1 FL=1